MVRQTEEQCPHIRPETGKVCGSWYRDGTRCNICGNEAPTKEQLEEILTVGGKEIRGRKFSANKHRYLTSKEIRNGEKGG